MTRYPDDPSSAPQKPGIFRRMYNAIVGNTSVQTPTKEVDAAAVSKPYVTEATQLTIDELENKYAWMTPEEFDEKMLEISREGRARRLSANRGMAVPPIVDAEPDVEPDAEPDAEPDTEPDTDLYEEMHGEHHDTQEPMSGGGSAVLGNAALATIIVAMAFFQS